MLFLDFKDVWGNLRCNWLKKKLFGNIIILCIARFSKGIQTKRLLIVCNLPKLIFPFYNTQAIYRRKIFG